MHLTHRSLLVVACSLAGTALGAPAPELVTTIDQQVRALAPGATQLGTPVEGSAPKLDWSAALEPGRCYFLGGAAVGAKRLSLFMWGPDGRRVADAKPHGTTVMLSYCPTYAGLYRVQAKIEGKGSYVVATYSRTTTTTPPPLVSTPPGQAPAYPAAYAPPPRPAYAPPPTYPVYPTYPAAAAVTVGGVVVGVGGGMPTSGSECRMGADGINVCGYNCRIGANGHMYCSGVPDGQCALNADGTFTCPVAVAPGAVYVPGAGYGNPGWEPERGHRNDPCQWTSDCARGLFCREDSDGYKMCM